jgi:hypothetical protein
MSSRCETSIWVEGGSRISWWSPSIASASRHGWRSNVPETATAPIKYMFCYDADATFNASGSGSKDFRVLNVRVPVFFALFSGGKYAPVLLATSATLLAE